MSMFWKFNFSLFIVNSQVGFKAAAFIHGKNFPLLSRLPCWEEVVNEHFGLEKPLMLTHQPEPGVKEKGIHSQAQPWEDH